MKGDPTTNWPGDRITNHIQHEHSTKRVCVAVISGSAALMQTTLYTQHVRIRDKIWLLHFFSQFAHNIKFAVEQSYFWILGSEALCLWPIFSVIEGQIDS